MDFEDLGKDNCDGASIFWFRHGLRFHDNPALFDSLKNQKKFLFYPVFIFDGETAGTKVTGYNRMKFLLESLNDLDQKFRSLGGRLFVFRDIKPVDVFRKLHPEIKIKQLSFEQDCEAIWRTRDNITKELCDKELKIEWVERVSHTLWDPLKVLEENNGEPPLTYQSFLYIVSSIGEPPRPIDDIDWTGVKFGTIPSHLTKDLNLCDHIPTPEELGYNREFPQLDRLIKWTGGETFALKNLTARLKVEENAFRDGYYLPNQINPDLLAPPTSQSAALRFGCLSVRKFYWSLHDLYKKVHGDTISGMVNITGQLIWREFFYTMCVNNEYYAEMKRNPICIPIPWDQSEQKDKQFKAWCLGKTGYPFIDASMRQLLAEGWIHHVARNAVACFLTRGDLWISWERGLNHFLKYLIDADWSVCAGNWMWVSSSAFEKLLDCSDCICPVSFGRRFDPQGIYIKRYLPELRSMPERYIYEPWNAPIEVQENANCIIGRDYPERVVDHQIVSQQNARYMDELRHTTIELQSKHCRPSNEMETFLFLGLSSECHNHHKN